MGLSTTPIVYTTGEIDVTTPVSFLSVTGSTTFSLPAGTIGQIKILVCTVAASVPLGVVTPIASAIDGYDTFTFDEKGQSATLIYENSGWIILSSTARDFSQSNQGYADFMNQEDGVGTGEAVGRIVKINGTDFTVTQNQGDFFLTSGTQNCDDGTSTSGNLIGGADVQWEDSGDTGELSSTEKRIVFTDVGEIEGSYHSFAGVESIKTRFKYST